MHVPTIWRTNFSRFSFFFFFFLDVHSVLLYIPASQFPNPSPRTFTYWRQFPLAASLSFRNLFLPTHLCPASPQYKLPLSPVCWRHSHAFVTYKSWNLKMWKRICKILCQCTRFVPIHFLLCVGWLKAENKRFYSFNFYITNPNFCEK